MEIYAKNGGMIRLYDIDDTTKTPGPTHYYEGMTTTKMASIAFDFQRPVHCHCGENWLDVGEPFTTDVFYTHSFLKLI